jgi:hypothetical protein
MDDENPWFHITFRLDDIEFGKLHIRTSLHGNITAKVPVTKTLRRRLPPVKKSGPFIQLHDFKDLVFSIYCLGGFVGFLGIYTGMFDLWPTVCQPLILSCQFKHTSISAQYCRVST